MISDQQWRTRVVIGKSVGFVTGFIAAAILHAFIHPVELLNLLPVPVKQEPISLVPKQCHKDTVPNKRLPLCDRTVK